MGKVAIPFKTLEKHPRKPIARPDTTKTGQNRRNANLTLERFWEQNREKPLMDSAYDLSVWRYSVEYTGTRGIPGPHGLISTQERHLEAPKHTHAMHIHEENTRNHKIL